MHRISVSADIDHRHRYDAVVIGSGLVGGWVAKELVGAGLETLVLEAGPVLEPEDVCDATSWSRQQLEQAARRQPIQSRNAAWLSTPNLFVDDFEHPYVVAANAPFTWIRGRQLGGRSVTWGGVTLRMSDYELRDPERDGIGPRWPIAYADLKPYYDTVERFLGVSGSAEGLAQLPDGIFAPPPPLTEAEQMFKARVEQRWSDRKVIVGRGVVTEGSSDECVDRRWSSKSALHRVLPAASASGRLTIRPNSIVSHVSIDTNTAKACGVAGVDRLTRRTFEARAGVVVLCASTIESLRILLNSRTRQHPAGVGNSSGLLGRGLIDHIAVSAAGPLSGDQRVPACYPFGGPHSVSIPRFRNLSSDERHRFRRGYGVWGHVGRGRSLDEQRWFLTAVLEVLSRDDNRVEIDPSVVDEWGIKSVRVRLVYGENEWAMTDDATETLNELAAAADLAIARRRVSEPGYYVHELGGARMGSDPATSVLNPFNQCWDAANVFVVDGSCFPSAGWQNPTLTMMALAVRASERLVAEKRLDRL